MLRGDGFVGGRERVVVDSFQVVYVWMNKQMNKIRLFLPPFEDANTLFDH